MFNFRGCHKKLLSFSLAGLMLFTTSTPVLATSDRQRNIENRINQAQSMLDAAEQRGNESSVAFWMQTIADRQADLYAYLSSNTVSSQHVTPAPVAPQPVTPDGEMQSDIDSNNSLSSRPQDFAEHEVLDVELELLRLINKERAEHELEPLILDFALSVVARSHSEDMAINNFISHTGSNGYSPRNRVQGADIAFRLMSENVAHTRVRATPFDDAEAVFLNWLNSPGHRANILNPHRTHIGIGQARNNMLLTWTLKLTTS